MHKIWDLAKTTPQAALDWLSMQVARNRHVQTWLLSSLENWVEPHLLAHMNAKVSEQKTTKEIKFGFSFL